MPCGETRGCARRRPKGPRARAGAIERRRASPPCPSRPGSWRPCARAATLGRRPPPSGRRPLGRPGCRLPRRGVRSPRRRTSRHGTRGRSPRRPRSGSPRPRRARERARPRRRASPGATPGRSPRREPRPGPARRRRARPGPQSAKKKTVSPSPWSRTSNRYPSSVHSARSVARAGGVGHGGEDGILGVGRLFVGEVDACHRAFRQPAREDRYVDSRRLHRPVARRRRSWLHREDRPLPRRLGPRAPEPTEPLGTASGSSASRNRPSGSACQVSIRASGTGSRLVESLAVHDDPLTQRLARVAEREVAVEVAHAVLAEQRAA